MAVLIGTLLLAAPSAMASDAKFYPATMCDLWGDEDNMDNAQFLGKSQFGRLGNTNLSEPLYVVCPIVRDNTGNTNGLNLAKIWLDDNHGFDDFSCTLRSSDAWGDTSGFDYQTLSTSGFQDVAVHYWNVGSSGAHNNTVGGTYQFFCRIPPMDGGTQSFIGSYYVEEP